MNKYIPQQKEWIKPGRTNNFYFMQEKVCWGRSQVINNYNIFFK